MKTLFTKDEILLNVGCYSKEDAIEILKGKTKFTIDEILSLDIPLKDKAWFIRKRCEFTDTQFRKFAIGCAYCVLPIYEAKYPENKAPREAIEAAEQYLAGTIDIDVLRQKRTAAYAAYAAANAAYAAAYAAYAADAAAYAAAYAAYAAANAAYAAANAAYAADAAANAAYAANAAANAAYAADAAANADAVIYQDLLLQFFKSFFKETE
jgi:hypothetical protein